MKWKSLEGNSVRAFAALDEDEELNSSPISRRLTHCTERSVRRSPDSGAEPCREDPPLLRARMWTVDEGRGRGPSTAQFCAQGGGRGGPGRSPRIRYAKQDR